jgi:nucleoside-diphosphate-sugar epimerase
MDIAIIGCGYVGLAAAKFWQQKMTIMVTATTTTPERLFDLKTVVQKVEVVRGNDASGLEKVLKGQDIVLLSIARKRNSSYQETYLDTAKTFVDVLKSSSVKQVIYTSSCSVYGNQNGALVNEETAVTPTSEGEEILKQTEDVLLAAANKDLLVCILRLGGIFGPDRELLKIYSRVAGTTLPGDGNEPANWIHLDDIVGAVEFARLHRLQGIYNVVNDANLLRREIINKVCETHHLPKVTWDSSQQSTRLFNAKVSNQKIKDAGFKLIRPEMIF